MPSGGLTVPLKFSMSSYKMTCHPVTKPAGLTYRWLAREDQTPSLIALPETRVSSRLPQLLAISAFSFCPPPLREMHGLQSHYISIDQMLYFLWIFHFHNMEGMPSLVGILLSPIGICGLPESVIWYPKSCLSKLMAPVSSGELIPGQQLCSL